MQTLTLSSNHFLDNFVLNSELSTICGISGNAYKYWKQGVAARFEGSRTIFLQRLTLPEKYRKLSMQCTPLEGFVPAQAFCAFTGLASSHLTKSNGSKLYEKLEIKTVC
ncbi:MAG: cysteine permease, partial [Campylobacteraceae bacterium]|nr:cysteine permease [Campylobacteraceae bacterium]